MNPRVLELLKDPKSIQSEDLHLLKEEINSFPYIQNIRALHLYGVHLYDKENYQKELSTTAAYTTDKKILYQLINGKIQQKQKPEIKVEAKKPEFSKNTFNYTYKSSNFPLKREEKEETKENVAIPAQELEVPEVVKSDAVENQVNTSGHKYEEAARLLQNPKPEIKDVFVKGERNRILFEGEENFLDDENVEKIDLESTLESGVIVTQKAEVKDPVSEINDSENIVNSSGKAENSEEIKEEFTPETIIEEENISSKEEKEEINDEVSFHEIENVESQQNIQTNEIVEEKIEEEDVKRTETSIAEFTPETIINEEKISSEKVEETVNDESELSFHETQSFLPEINIQTSSEEEKPTQNNTSPEVHGLQAFLTGTKIQTNNPEQKQQENKPAINKHEEEMRRLIEEVEKKMKESKKDAGEKEKEEPEIISHDISFAETQSFDVKSVEKDDKENEFTKSDEPKSETKENQESKREFIAEKPVEIQEKVQSSWKPMSFEPHVPDSLLNKTQEIPQPKIEAPKEETPKQEEILPEIKELPKLVKDQSQQFGTATKELQKDPEAPVMNVSFFNSDTIASWKVDLQKEEEKMEEEVKEIPQKTSQAPVDSNVPGFINTWQSWLKIDRTPEVEEKDKIEIKNKVIETFIETNPKISQLKDEVNFVVKEKNDDISHLMTETLANLYFEQKLYTKAIKAFEVLMNKFPEKKDYFEAKIQEIKDNRTKN
ncbi:hypothetical protein SAMN05421664_1765 [Chryseobacterium soldanellicola]|uniref:Tetratricopeptide repeat-containing protein n=1 Tax=Chryseobacterium soldanellicola TaxID=311333 RepID=A0A1H1B8J3_9FLAO|nr:hypothetical protein [Chryseobacterium soldanellicola]SDQ48210.1 hypothetical protein SAMN05421664_1765 [Chryseobacterium soldanellicola]